MIEIICINFLVSFLCNSRLIHLTNFKPARIKNVHRITTKEVMAPLFSINTAWGKFQECDASFSLVLNWKAMHFIMLLNWKKLYMVQELWSDTFHLTARILIQKREVITIRPKTSFGKLSLPLALCVYLYCMLLRKFHQKYCEEYFRNSGYELRFDRSNNFEPFRYIHRCFLCRILELRITELSLVIVNDVLDNC